MSNRNRMRATKPPAKRSPLPLFLIAGGGLLLLAVAAWILSSRSGGAGGTPKLEVTQIQPQPEAATRGLNVDYGDMQLGAENASLVVNVTNRGDGVLRFTEQPYVELAAGCWPPDAVIGSMTLQPGATTTVSLQFSMHGDMGGFHDFRLHLPTNDPSNPDTVVTITSNWVE